jgi:hypothetical protein
MSGRKALNVRPYRPQKPAGSVKCSQRRYFLRTYCRYFPQLQERIIDISAWEAARAENPNLRCLPLPSKTGQVAFSRIGWFISKCASLHLPGRQHDLHPHEFFHAERVKAAAQLADQY